MNAWWNSSEVLGRIAGSLLHFLWQGALIAFVSAILLRLLARRSAASRYAVAVVCLGLMVLAPCVTFIFYSETGGATLRVLQFLNRSAAEAGKSATAAGVAVWTAWIVAAWAVGVSICGIRLLMGWILSRGLIRSARVTVPVGMSQLMERIRKNMIGSRRVRFLIGERVDSPVVFGWIRPVVLLPVAAITGLSEEQLLAVLAHELAHIRRHDFLVNALQRGVESVLFYHPAVWWLSSRIRTEREHCCDDLAVQVCGDRFVYAEALIELERARATVPALAIPAAAGNLGERVRRVLGIRSVNREWQPAVAALLLVAVCALAGSWQSETIAATSLRVLPPAPARVESPVTAIAAIVTAQTQRVATPAATQSSAQSESPQISPARAAARKELGQLLVPYSAESFAKQAGEGDSIAVKLFLAAGMSPNVIAQIKTSETSSFYGTPLIRAAAAGQTETVKVLIAGHADVNLRAGRQTPLLAAAFGDGNAETVKALLAAGASVDAKENEESCYANPPACKQTALMGAAISGRIEVVKALLESGADVRSRRNDGRTALFLAVASDNVSAVKTLLDAGANVNDADNNGTTPLLAAYETDLEMIKLLLDRKADVNARDDRGYSILFKVASYRSPNAESLKTEKVKLLLLRGADVNLTDTQQGSTPLIEAASAGSIDSVKLLLEKGADVNAKSNRGQTALKAAGNRTDIVQVLVNAGAK